MTSCSPHALRIEQEETGLDWSMRERFLAGTAVKLESLIKECDFLSLSLPLSFWRFLRD